MSSRTIIELEEEVLATFLEEYSEEDLQQVAKKGSTYFPEWYSYAIGIVPDEPEALLQIALSHPDFFTKEIHTESLEIMETVSPQYLVRQNIVWYLVDYLGRYWKTEYLRRGK